MTDFTGFKGYILKRIRDKIDPERYDKVLDKETGQWYDPEPNDNILSNREQMIFDVVMNIVSVYAGAFERVERIMGPYVWAYNVPDSVFSAYNGSKQDEFKRNYELWNECRASIKNFSNKMIDATIDKMSMYEIGKKNDMIYNINFSRNNSKIDNIEEIEKL